MDFMKEVDLIEWAKEKFVAGTDIGDMVRNERLIAVGLSAYQIDQLAAAREGWLIGLAEGGPRTPQEQEIDDLFSRCD